MLRDKLTPEEIKKEIVDNNLFGAPNEYRANRYYGYISRRAASLDDKAIDLFFDSDLTTQKLMNFICILRTSRIYFDFINEVYCEKIILGAEELSLVDTRIFFNNKTVQSEEIAAWKEPTKKRIQSAFLTIMTETNLLIDKDKKKIINPPIIDVLLEKYLEGCGETDIIRALTGGY